MVQKSSALLQSETWGSHDNRFGHNLVYINILWILSRIDHLVDDVLACHDPPGIIMGPAVYDQAGYPFLSHDSDGASHGLRTVNEYPANDKPLGVILGLCGEYPFLKITFIHSRVRGE